MDLTQPGPREEPQDTPQNTPGRPPARRGGRAALTLLIVALIAAAATGAAIGWQQREVAAGWQERARVLEQQRDDAVGRSEALSEQLGELANLVQLSVEDLAGLEDRLAELAGEKARAEDRAAVTREDLRTLAARVERAVGLLETCAADLLVLQSDTVDAFNRVSRGETVDVGPLNSRLEAVSARCREAREAGAAALALSAQLR